MKNVYVQLRTQSQKMHFFMFPISFFIFYNNYYDINSALIRALDIVSNCHVSHLHIILDTSLYTSNQIFYRCEWIWCGREIGKGWRNDIKVWKFLYYFIRLVSIPYFFTNSLFVRNIFRWFHLCGVVTLAISATRFRSFCLLFR